jgi:acetyl esterase/lipase
MKMTALDRLLPVAAALLFMTAPSPADNSIADIAPFPANAPIPPWTPLYDGPAPDSQGTQDKDAPHVEMYLPPKGATPTAAIILCPGGGYSGLALDHEGRFESVWLQAHNIAAFVLQYRLPGQGYRHPIPMHDGQRAIRWVRAQADKFNIDPHKIGIMGFSAGGHEASTVATHFDAGDPNAKDPIDRVSSRPDFAVLVYAVITMKAGVTHQGSKDNLLGPNPDPALVANLSNETQVTAQTPPMILFHAIDDGVVPIENARDMLAALSQANVPGELHEYSKGGHGFGWGATPDNSPKGWFDQTLYDWLKRNGFAS